MPCTEIVELESVWKKQFDRANQVAAGGLFAVSIEGDVQAPTLRHLRARQAQAAFAILLHQRHCAECNLSTQAEPFTWSDSSAALAS